jgi:hypothetical protein
MASLFHIAMELLTDGDLAKIEAALPQLQHDGSDIADAFTVFLKDGIKLAALAKKADVDLTPLIRAIGKLR